MGPEGKWKLSALSNDFNETRIGSNDNSSVFQIIPRTFLEEQAPSKKLFQKVNKCLAVASAGSAPGQLGLAVGNDLLIFDAKAEVVEHTLPFPSPIDIIIWNRCLLLVGLSSSEMYFLHPSTFEQLDTRTAEASADVIVKKSTEGRFYVNGFIQVEDGSCDICAVSIEGKVYRFQTSVAPDNTLDYTRLETSVCPPPLSEASVRTTINTEQVITSAHFVNSNFIFIADKSGNITLLELGNDDKPAVIAANNIVKELCQSPADVSVKKMIRCEGLLFVLLSSGTLEILFDDFLCSTGSLKLPIANAKVHDFTVVLCDQDIKLWAVFGDFTNPEDIYIGVFAGASFKPVLCVQVPSWSSTVELNEPIKLDSYSVCFSEQCISAEEPNSFICALPTGFMLFQVMKSSVESTLHRFLSLGKFEQATMFAEKYSFDMDIVKKARVQAYYNDLLTCKNEVKLERIFEEMLTLLRTISDTDYVCKFCICDHEKVIPKIDWVQKILKLGCGKAITIAGTEHGKTLLVLGKKFYTFQQVFPSGTVEDWKQFCNPANSLFQICKLFLQNEQFSYCNSVWTRHSEEFIHELNVGDLAEFFWALFSKQLSTNDCITLFQTILNDALDKCVQDDFDEEKGLTGIIELIKKQICSLERRLSWPIDAIKFVQTLINIFNSEIVKLQESLRSPRPNPKSEDKVVFCQKLVNRLNMYQQSLHDLSDLIKAHAMRVAFTKFITDDPCEVVNLMLDELFSREEIGAFVQKFLKPYAQRSNLSLDFLFQNYIESIIIYVSNYSSGFCIPFEERLVSLVELIGNVERKLNCAYLIACDWPVPWSAGVESMVTRVLNILITPEVENRSECLKVQKTIADIQKQVPFQCLLYKYRLLASKLSNPVGVSMALMRILVSEKVDAYEDALELVKFTGKQDADDVLALKIRLEFDREDFSGNVEDIFPIDMSRSAAEKMRDLFINLQSFVDERLTTQAKRDRWKKAAEYLSKRLDSHEEIEFLQLKKILPEATNFSTLFDPSYPFIVVDRILFNLIKLSVAEILEQSNHLARISHYPNHEIIVAIIFTMLQQQPMTSVLNTKIWELLTKVITIPCVLRAPILEELIMCGLPALVYQMPSLTLDQQQTLESFIKIVINSFDKSFPELSKIIAIQGIFMTLRDLEIPLENDFLTLIHEMLFGQGKKVAQWVEQLTNLSMGLIKYGEHDLMIRIINTIILNYEYIRTQTEEPEISSYCTEVVRRIAATKCTLIDQSMNYRESEPNVHVQKLVESLRVAGVYMNAYSLRNRNKKKLINILLKNEEFRLASDIALVFQYWEKEEWALILQGFMDDGNIKSLKNLLIDIKNITELWVIPEFSKAWVLVSESHPEFQSLCPIGIFV